MCFGLAWSTCNEFKSCASYIHIIVVLLHHEYTSTWSFHIRVLDLKSSGVFQVILCRPMTAISCALGIKKKLLMHHFLQMYPAVFLLKCTYETHFFKYCLLCSERFMVRLNKNGGPRNPEKIDRMCALFTVRVCSLSSSRYSSVIVVTLRGKKQFFLSNILSRSRCCF